MITRSVAKSCLLLALILLFYESVQKISELYFYQKVNKINNKKPNKKKRNEYEREHVGVSSGHRFQITLV